MLEQSSQQVETAKKILVTFALYGFQKTSMQDIAKAAGVSRQSVYKRYGSKEQCYEQVIKLYLADMYYRIFSILERGEASPIETLVQVFSIFVGEPIDVVTSTHGTEVFDDCLHLTHTSKEDWPLRFRARLADFLHRHDLASANKAEGVAFTMIYAGKGMLLEKRSQEQCHQDIKLMLTSTTNQI
jgi:AcrR family transcriptional regulator